MDDRSASMLELKALHVPRGHYDVAVDLEARKAVVAK